MLNYTLFKAVFKGKLRAQCWTSVTSSTITSWQTFIIENHGWSSHGLTTLQSRCTKCSTEKRQQARPTCDRLQLVCTCFLRTKNKPTRTRNLLHNLPKPDIYGSADAPDLSQTPPWGRLEPNRSRGWKKTVKKRNVRSHLRTPRSPSPGRLYLWAQACSTSAMVFGASRERIRGAPGCWITTSSSILTPRPRKRFGAWSLSSLMYRPGTKQSKIRRQSKNVLPQKSK